MASLGGGGAVHLGSIPRNCTCVSYRGNICVVVERPDEPSQEYAALKKSPRLSHAKTHV
jgi:hypothetical protein